MTDGKKITATEVTAEVIASWKERHGKITKYTTTDGKVVYFRSPSRAEVAASSTVREEKDGISANEVLAKACALGGDVEILTQTKYLFGLGKHLSSIVEQVQGETEEL
jgi:hypothetical protein